MAENKKNLVSERKYKQITKDLVADVAAEVLTKLDYEEFKQIMHRFKVNFKDIVKSMNPGANDKEILMKQISLACYIYRMKAKYAPKKTIEEIKKMGKNGEEKEYLTHIEPYDPQKHKKSRVSPEHIEHFVKCISEDIELRNLYQMLIEEHEDKIKITNIYEEEK